CARYEEGGNTFDYW
nr:immunoglobulin heavy chain junction region [Macaca mulatta]